MLIFKEDFYLKFINLFLLVLTSRIKALSEFSNAAYSLLKTLPKSYCSKPPWVTVKLIMVVLALNSGENKGLGNLQVMNITKCLLYSI
jgi:hypothetical protein